MGLGACWLCEGELTKTEEHIIPDSIGGRRIVVGFICQACNSRTGSSWDAAVSNFDSWRFVFDQSLVRSQRRTRSIRGQIPDLGLNVYIDAGGLIRVGNNAPATTQARSGETLYTFTSDPDEIDQLFETINRFCDRRGIPLLSRAEFDAGVGRQQSSTPVEFGLTLESGKYFRSIVKTAVAMAFSLGIDPKKCENAVAYLKDGTADPEGVVSPFPGGSLKEFQDDWLDYHSVTILGLPKDRKLIAEVVYFGSVVGATILSNAYNGEFLVGGHSVHLRTGETMDVDLSFPDIYIPEHSINAVWRDRIERFNSPMVRGLLSSGIID